MKRDDFLIAFATDHQDKDRRSIKITRFYKE